MNLRPLLNSDFRHTIINQLWKLFSGPLMLVLLPLYLTAEAQGYWYTFISLAALAIFADMGFSSVLIMFSAHEFAHLKFNNDKTLVGDEHYLIRLATLWKFSLKWSTIMATIFFPLVLLLGYFILDEKTTELNWKLAWIIYGLASVFVFCNSMILSFIEGCNSVGEVQKIRFQVSVITVTITILLLIIGSDLYALSCALLAGALSGSAIVILKYRALFLQLSHLAKNHTHPWWRETIPLIWRYALSWISGYFIFSIFTPLAFHYYGAIQAGQVGLSLSACMAIFGIANIWLTIITPKINIAVAQHDHLYINKIFRLSFCMAIATYTIGFFLLLLILYILKDKPSFTERLLPIEPLLMMGTGWLLQIAINSMAIYIRAHKQEPLVFASILNGLYVATITLLTVTYLPLEYLFIGFLSAYIITLPWVCRVFNRYRRRHA